MTREEAIKWLTDEKWENANNTYKKEWNEAFDLAIEALKAPQTDLISRAAAVDACCRGWNNTAEDCIRNIKEIPSAKLPKGDLISRAEVIGIVEDYISKDYMTPLSRLYSVRSELSALPSADAEQGVGRYENAMQKLREMPRYLNGVKEKQITKISADAEQGYTEWLEKIIVDNEGANEWLCEDTPDLEWCEKNCHYSSIQAECLRHLYEVSKGGDTE